MANGERARGILKSRAEDFRVEEITQNGTVLEIDKAYTPDMLGFDELSEGKFSIFVMQKTNWNTAQALKAIARKFRRGIKSTAFAGTKDRTSISTQLCSIFGVKPEELKGIHVKDISINGAWYGNSKVEMGSLVGNRFGIVARDASNCNNIESIMQELQGIFPNYFGEQRFGNRGINVEVGTAILKGDFESAAMKFLTETQNETNEDAKEARTRLAKELDFKEAMKYFPEYLKYERLMIEYLVKYPSNYANAIRKLPRSISLMLIHSVEAHIFNKSLEERISSNETNPKKGDIVCPENTFGFPDLQNTMEFDSAKGRQFVLGNIVGYDTEHITETEQKVMEELGITMESFKVQGLNELNSRGTHRVMFAPYKDIRYSCNDDDTIGLNFSLPLGSYATVFMDEFIENSKLTGPL